jgi:hypothetical protein
VLRLVSADPVEQVLHALGTEAFVTLGRPVALGVEPLGDRGGVQARRGQLAGPCGQLGPVAQLFQPGHWPDQLPTGPHAARPGDGHLDPLAVAVDGDRDPLDDLADELLAVGVGGGRGPQRGDVGGQPADGGALVGRQGARLGGGEPAVGLSELLLGGELVLPGPLRLPGDQPVLRLGELVLTPGTLSLKAGPFQPLLPQPVQVGTIPLDLLGGLQRQLQHGWGERGQDLGGDEAVHTRGPARC